MELYSCRNIYSIDGDVSGNHGGGDYWIVKINSIGLIDGQNVMEVDMEANAIYQTSDEGYIIVGTFCFQLTETLQKQWIWHELWLLGC